MQHDFWKKRWEEGQIGFHLPEANPALVRWWGTLGVDPDDVVLVPLCGKSHDLAWLHEAGHPVIGVELAEIACVAFFKEHGWVPAVDHEGLYRRYRHGELTILEGDFLHLPAGEGFAAVYDRASLIALPPAMREAYGSKLTALTVPGAHVLLLTLDYTQEGRSGPPFAVPESEVRRLYGGAFDVTLLQTIDLLAQDPARYAGASRAIEQVWHLVRR